VKTKDDIETDGTIYANDIQFKRGKQGQILYRDKDKWRKLDPGTAGQFLKTQGANANPVWANVPSGGGSGDIRIQTGTYVGNGDPTQQITINNPNCSRILHVQVIMKAQLIDSQVGGTGFKIDVMSGFGMQFLGAVNDSPYHVEEELITFTQPNKFNVLGTFNGLNLLYHYIAFYRCGIS